MTPVERKAHVWKRDALDWYVEPEDCTTALLGVERFRGRIWDPACGAGNIVRAADAFGRIAMSTDVVNRGWDRDNVLWRGEKDFLATPVETFECDNIICNPPFFRGEGTEAFIRHALSAPALAKLAIFTDVRFLNSKKRAQGLFLEHEPDRVWIIAPRPSCPPGEYLKAGHKAGGGTADFCWIVWDRTAPHSSARLGWLQRLPFGIEAVQPVAA